MYVTMAPSRGNGSRHETQGAYAQVASPESRIAHRSFIDPLLIRYATRFPSR